MHEAKDIIAAGPGFASLRVERCVEHPSRFLLLVEWEHLEDHTEGFRGSAAYERWRAPCTISTSPSPWWSTSRRSLRPEPPGSPESLSGLVLPGPGPSRNFIHVALCSWVVHVQPNSIDLVRYCSERRPRDQTLRRRDGRGTASSSTSQQRTFRLTPAKGNGYARTHVMGAGPQPVAGRRHKLAMGSSLAGALVLSIVAATAAGATSAPPANPITGSTILGAANNVIVGAGSATTYNVMQDLDTLFNNTPGCVLTTGSFTYTVAKADQELNFSCVDESASGSQPGTTLERVPFTAGDTGGAFAYLDNPLNDVAFSEPLRFFERH